MLLNMEPKSGLDVVQDRPSGKDDNWNLYQVTVRSAQHCRRAPSWCCRGVALKVRNHGVGGSLPTPPVMIRLILSGSHAMTAEEKLLECFSSAFRGRLFVVERKVLYRSYS